MKRSGYSSARLRLAMVGVVGLVFLLAFLDLRREQAHALDDFIGEQASLARSIAATMSARLELVSRDLQAALEPAEEEQAGAVLRKIVARDSSYLELDLLDASGVPLRQEFARAAPPISHALVVHARAGLHARLATSSSAISSMLDQGSGRRQLRLFGLHDGDRAAMVAVDMDLLFSDVRGTLRAPGVPVRCLAIDDSGGVLELDAAADGSLRSNPFDTAHGSAEIDALRSGVTGSEAGASLLGRTSADAMGLGRRLAVAGFSPVPLGGDRRWTVVIITSASRVRDRARFTAWRLAVTTALASILVALFGGAIGRQQRRELRLAEALKLAETTAALRERSEKMIEVIPIGVLALDARQRVVSANPYLMDRGVRPGSPLAAALPSASVDEIAILEALLNEARDTRQPRDRIGLVLHLSKGERRDIDAYAIPLGRPLSDVDCFLVLHDRTEIRSLERNLVRAEKLATIGTLAAGVAHEMGTPLGIISGRAEQLLARIEEGEVGELARKNVASILAQVDKVSTTIRQLLDFARVRPIKTEVVSTSQALSGAAALLEPHFRQAQVSLDVGVKPTVAPLAADPGQLEQVLVNLLMNACDACAAGGHVWARAHVLGERVVIEISDDGAGIAKEDLPMIMDPFFTTKKRGQGTGLGLSIAADIVKNHGGALEVDSVLGEGTTVRVSLPKAQPPHGART